MTEADFSLCAYCPRLCRHVCPVAVGTGGEAAVPAVLMTAPLLVLRGTWSVGEGLGATTLCLHCGACTVHCHSHVPVAARLAAWRAEHGERPARAPLAPILGEAPVVCVLEEEPDWSAAWARNHGREVACVRTSDALGFAAWSLDGSSEDVREHFAGRSVVTASAEVEAVARAAGVHVERLPAPSEGPRFVTCHEAAVAGPGQLACCGRRGGFDRAEPEAASAVAAENARRMHGERWSCSDQACADWLRRAGADIRGPVDELNGGGQADG